MKLHTLTFSPNGRKAECLIAYLGIDAEIHQVAMDKGEHKSEAFLAMNPNGKIPVLEDDGFFVWESNAILTYLAAKHPDKNLLPADPKERSLVERWLFWQGSHLGPSLYSLVFEKVLKKQFGKEPDPARIEEAMNDLAAQLPVLDKQLEGKEYVCGSLSVADFAIGPWAEGGPAFGVDYARYPNLRAWLERIIALPGWIKQPQFG